MIDSSHLKFDLLNALIPKDQKLIIIDPKGEYDDLIQSLGLHVTKVEQKENLINPLNLD